jgi:hypothetical protein
MCLLVTGSIKNKKTKARKTEMLVEARAGLLTHGSIQGFLRDKRSIISLGPYVRIGEALCCAQRATLSRNT